MDRLDAGGHKSRPQPGGVVVPSKRASLKGHSSAGNVFTDNEDESIDKKPRIDHKPDARVLADLGNAPRPSGSAATADKSAIDELKTIESKLAKYKTYEEELRVLPVDKREPDHYQQVDAVNSKVVRLEAALRTWERTNGPREQAQVGGGGGGGVAGGTGWHLDEAARRRIELEQQLEAVRNLAADPMAQVMAQASGSGNGNGAGAAPSEAGSEDPYDAMNRAGGGARVRGVARTEEFDEFVKKALEGESFEGNANGQLLLAPICLTATDSHHCSAHSRRCCRSSRSQFSTRMPSKHVDSSHASSADRSCLDESSRRVETLRRDIS
jgi:hypothetical protein